MSPRRPTALLADDEPLLREGLARMLGQAWPELELVAHARSGREAVEAFEAKQPDICFLDIHMPRMSGVEAARLIGRRAHLVFVTAFDEYAIQAFEQGAVDYLVKPVEAARLADTVARLQTRLRAERPGPSEELLERLAARIEQRDAPSALRWLRVSVGRSIRVVAVEEIEYLRSDEKYTLVAWRTPNGPGEGLVRTPLKELLAQLDPDQFLQIHRSAVVNLRAVSHLLREANETGTLHLRDREESLPVSRAYLHHFRQM